MTGDQLVAHWNAAKPCRLHVVASMSFAAQLEKGTAHILRVGVATGSMLHGNVGTHKARFATMQGAPLGTAYALSEHALVLGTFALLADCTGSGSIHQSEDMIRNSSRLVDAWYLQPASISVMIYEVLCTRLRSAIGMWGEDDDLDKNGSPLDLWTRNVLIFLSEGKATEEGSAALTLLSEMAQSSESEPILEVCNLKEKWCRTSCLVSDRTK